MDEKMKELLRELADIWQRIDDLAVELEDEHILTNPGQAMVYGSFRLKAKNHCANLLKLLEDFE